MRSSPSSRCTCDVVQQSNLKRVCSTEEKEHMVQNRANTRQYKHGIDPWTFETGDTGPGRRDRF